jgi:outer membrane receptor protein involved in Fe transport
MKIYLFILSLFFCGISFAQTTISGTVKDSKNQPIAGANVKIVGENSSTNADFDGTFTLKSSKASASVEVTMVGYTTKRTQSTTSGKLEIVLQAEETKLNEIVVSASRTPERVLESPVTIERMTLKDIKKTAAPTFYDGLENMKEVQMNTSSMSFKSINTRGFATVANTRFMQLVDGMDNSSPLLNFVLGNLIGVSEIDVQSVELLPGASSALYGANAFNGILFMTSKSPFTNEGISTYLKYGQTSQKAAGQNTYYDFGVRVAKAFSRHFAAKANVTFMRGTDWYATDERDIDINNRSQTRDSFSYNGINIYGDEAALKIGAAGLPDAKVSRTGFKETDLTDNKVTNTKADLSLHLKPFNNDFEVIWQSKFGFGNTVYQGASRYYLNNFFMQQHKLEIKGKDFFVRGYTTTEDGGRSYDMTFTALNINRTFKSDRNWFTDYATAYSQSVLAGQFSNQAHVLARNFADYNVSPSVLLTPLVPTIDPANPNAPRGIRYEPGTTEFKKAFKEVIANPDILKGSRLVDNSRIYHSDANYNFRQSLVKFAEVQVGGSYRLYNLNSSGRIYTDKDSQINYNEYGLYTQLRSKMLDDRLKLSASLRYDKAKNFSGNFSPRASVVYSAGSNKNHNFRASFQTGFRNPSTQDQYIGFNIGNAVLVGSAPDNLDRYREIVRVNPTVSPVVTPFAVGYDQEITGNDAYNNSFTAASATEFGKLAASNPVAAAALLRKTNVSLVKPETVKAIDLGYRGEVKGFSIDINGYYNVYNNFLGNVNALTPLYGTAQDSPNITTANPGSAAVNALLSGNTRAFQLYTNTNLEIKSIGVGLGLSRKVVGNFELSGNYNYAQFEFDKTADAGFEAGFNTPKHRAKATLSNDKLFGKLGMSIGGRWNSSYMWESTFADGMIAEATVIDVQANYNWTALKSTIKIGATNIGGKEYGQVIGAGLIGQQIYASWTLNP